MFFIHYVISDIHGQYTKLMELLNKINFNNEDTLYVLGDMMDRGNENLKVYEELMRRKNVEIIMGNHETMLLDYIKYNDRCWLKNGGDKTLFEIHNSDISFTELEVTLSELPVTMNIEVDGQKYFLCHSNPFGYSDEDIVWERIDMDMDYSSYVEDDTIYITGHTPLPYILGDKAAKKLYTSIDGNVWFIDYGAAYLGQTITSQYGGLGCVRLEDKKVFLV